MNHHWRSFRRVPVVDLVVTAGAVYFCYVSVFYGTSRILSGLEILPPDVVRRLDVPTTPMNMTTRTTETTTTTRNNNSTTIGLVARHDNKSTTMSDLGNHRNSALEGFAAHNNNDRTDHDGKQFENKTMVVGRVAPWRNSSVLPPWMKNYFQWHQDVRANMASTGNWSQHNFLIVRCFNADARCGGGADRLRTLPFILMLANVTRRFLVYKWERPCALEEFLVPPLDGLDWRWPPHPSLATSNAIHKGRLVRNNVNLFFKNNPGLGQFPSIIYQANGHGASLYNSAARSQPNTTTTSTFDQVFRDTWDSVFVPSDPVQSAIDKQMHELRLMPETYHAIHIRSMYIDNITQEKIHEIAYNSVNCLQQVVLSSDTSNTENSIANNNNTIFVASDARGAKGAVAHYARQRGIHRIVMTGKQINKSSTTSFLGVAHNYNRSHHSLSQNEEGEEDDEPILHIDRGNNFLNHKRPDQWNRYDPHRYYGSFVDLYILSQAKCLVSGLGVRKHHHLRFYKGEVDSFPSALAQKTTKPLSFLKSLFLSRILEHGPISCPETFLVTTIHQGDDAMILWLVVVPGRQDQENKGNDTNISRDDDIQGILDAHFLFVLLLREPSIIARESRSGLIGDVCTHSG